MSEKYRLMIYFAVATMHLYRKSVHDDPEDDIQAFKRKHMDLLLRVCQEGRNIFGYELSAAQLDAAIDAFRAAAQSVYETAPYENQF